MDSSYTCALRLSKDILPTLYNILTAVIITFSVKGCKWIFYVWLVVIFILIGNKYYWDGGVICVGMLEVGDIVKAIYWLPFSNPCAIKKKHK